MFSTTRTSKLRFIRNHSSRIPVLVRLKNKKEQRMTCNKHKKTISVLSPLFLMSETENNLLAQSFEASQETLGFSGKISTPSKS